MASIDIVPGPVDTVRAEGVWSKIRYHAAAHPLGVVGAAIMALFVFAAIFADFITSLRSDPDECARFAGAAEPRPLAGRR